MYVLQIQGGKKQKKVNRRENEYALGSRKSASIFSFLFSLFSFSFSINVYFWATVEGKEAKGFLVWGINYLSATYK